MSLHDDVEEILLDSEMVANRVAELAAQLSADYAGRDPVLVSVLKGALVFLADLMRAMDLPTSIDLMEVSSYGAATESSGQVRILKDLSKPIEGRDVIIVEDIIDTGLTLATLRRMISDRGAASVATAALLDKARRRVTDVPIEYRGFEVGDEFLVGYGLDWQGLYRNLTSIWVILDMEALVSDRKALATQLGHS